MKKRVLAQCAGLSRPAIQVGFLASAVALLLLPRGVFAQDRSRPEELIVSASATPLEASKVGSAVMLITADDLEIQGIQYASDALRHVPGVAVNRAGSFGGQTQVRVRGAEGNHTLVLIDGVEVASIGVGEFDFSSLLAEGIERVEVLRGPQSGLYGANAMGGVVNVITAGGANAAGLDVSVEAGSFHTTQAGFTARGGSDTIYGALTLTTRQTDGINTSQLGSEEDGDDNTALFGRGVVEVSDVLSLDGSFRVAEKDSDTDGYDFTGGPNQGLSIDSADFANTEDRQVAAGAQWSLRDGAWVTRIDAAYFEGETVGGVAPFGSEGSREQIRLQTTLELGSSGDSAQFFTAFIENEDETYRNTVPFDPSQVPELSRGITGIGLEYRAEIGERFFLSGAVRSDNNEGFDDATTYRITAAYLVGEGDSRLHGSYGTGVTNPTFFEQFGFIPLLFVGNLGLEPEESTGWDVGFERSFAGERMSFDATYFDADLENEIVDAFPSIQNDEGTSERSGIELTLSGQATDQLSISAMYTLMDADDPDGTEEIRRPENTASLDFTYRLERATLYGGVIYNGEMLDDDFRDFFVTFQSEKSPIDAYTVVNIGAYFDVSERLELYGRVQNLFDEKYEEIISYNTMGRAAFAGFRYSLGVPSD